MIVIVSVIMKETPAPAATSTPSTKHPAVGGKSKKKKLNFKPKIKGDMFCFCQQFGDSELVLKLVVLHKVCNCLDSVSCLNMFLTAGHRNSF